MFKITDLATSTRYLIEGERGEWYYSGVIGNKYKFWRSAVGTSRRVNITLSEYQVKRKIWSEIRGINLSNLEAFRGE